MTAVSERLARAVDLLPIPAYLGRDVGFVTGCSHSGTTIILRYLASLASVHAVPEETNVFRHATNAVAVRRAITSWRRDAHAHGRSFVCEKTPTHVFRIRRIHRYLPRARIVIVTRDGRDVVASLVRRGVPIDEAIDKWLRAVKASRTHGGDRRVLNVRYEEFTRSPSDVVQRIAEFFDLGDRDLPDHPSASFAFDLAGASVPAERPEGESGADHIQLRNWQINQPVYDSSGRWRDTFDAEQLHVVASAIGDELVALGYAADRSWSEESV